MRKVKAAHNLSQAQPDNQQPTESPMRLQQVTPAEKPLPPPPPQFNRPVGPPPPPAEAPRGFDAIFEMALKTRINGKPGMAEYWAHMAQADALNRIAREIHRTNEFLGVYDNDDAEDPEEEGTRLGGVLADAVVDGVMGSVEELLIFAPPEQRKAFEEMLKKNAEEDGDDEEDESEDEVQKQRDRDGYPKK